MTDALINQPLTSYELIKPLRSISATQAQIYLARHPQVSQPVVLKLMPIRRRSAELVLFMHELQILQTLAPFNQAQNWMPLLGFGKDFFLIKGKREQVNYMVLPYFEAGTVAQLIDLKTSLFALDQTQLGQLFLSMLDSVAALHAQGWLHLDLKPSNFLVQETASDARRTVVLADFGLAQMIAQSSDAQGYATQGTPKYMSPEQFLGQPLTPQTDYYALGLIFYELLTGASPYTASSYHQWAVQHCQQNIPLLPATLQHAQPLVDGLLAKQPEHRFECSNVVRQVINAAFNLEL